LPAIETALAAATSGSGTTFAAVGVTPLNAVTIAGTFGHTIASGGTVTANLDFGGFYSLVARGGSNFVRYDGASSASVSPGVFTTSIGGSTLVNGRLLAIDTDSNTIRFSDNNDVTSWTSSDFFSKEIVPSDAVGITRLGQDVLILGQDDLEIRTFDPAVASYALVPQGTMDIGCYGWQRPIVHNNAAYFLDNTLRLVAVTKSGARTFHSDFIRSELTGFFTDTDIALNKISLNEVNLIQFAAASNGELYNLVYNIDKDDWSMWGSGTSLGALNCTNWAQADVKQSVFLAGDVDSDDIYSFDETYTRDIPNETVFRKGFYTGWVSHNTEREKKTKVVKVSARTLYATEDTQLVLEHRDNNSTSWTVAEARTIPQSYSGDWSTVRFQARGNYRHRQYRIYTDSACHLQIGHVEEDYEWLTK
jgi:hypothetical protein